MTTDEMCWLMALVMQEVKAFLQFARSRYHDCRQWLSTEKVRRNHTLLKVGLVYGEMTWVWDDAALLFANRSLHAAKVHLMLKHHPVLAPTSSNRKFLVPQENLLINIESRLEQVMDTHTMVEGRQYSGMVMLVNKKIAGSNPYR